jgi:hypothetical protein
MLTPTGTSESFTVTLSGGNMTGMSGKIKTEEEDDPVSAPDSLTPIEKTLKITGYSASVMGAGTIHFTIIVPAGTSFSNIQGKMVASANAGKGVSIADGTATIQLKTRQGSNWAGSGTFDIWITPKGTVGGASWYKASNISITGETTTIAASSFVFDHQSQGGTEALEEHKGTWEQDDKTLVIEATKVTVSGGSMTTQTLQITAVGETSTKGVFQYNFNDESAIKLQLVNGQLVVLSGSGYDYFHGTWTKQS